MFIKIYFGDKPLYLCDRIDETLDPIIHHEDAVFIDELDAHTVKTMIHEMQQPQVHAGIFLHYNFDELKKAFQKKFTVIIAAGGLVKNERDEILMIFRRGSWDFPKGKLDEGESIEQCAVREVEEETGLTGVQLLAPLTTTFHTYHEGTKFVLKKSHWFTMSVAGSQELKPQAEEDITEIKWVNPKDIDQYLAGAYPLIADILAAAKEKTFISA